MSFIPNPPYSVPRKADSIFRDEILGNPLMHHLPADLKELSKFIHFEGNELPSIPVNWRWAESISALKAFEATMINYLLTQKYGIGPVDVTINTDHASLFIFSPHLVSVLDSASEPKNQINMYNLKPIDEEAPPPESHYRLLATGIYKTKDNRFYHIHGSLNPDPTLTALGLPLEGEDAETHWTSVGNIQKGVSKFEAEPLDLLMNSQYRQAGTIPYSSDEYFASDHGRANSNVGLYELTRCKSSSQPASWWPEHSVLPSPQRPLAGLKVVDLTRVYAGPTITSSLAELGASVMRVTSPHLPDFTSAFKELNWGKWNCELHLKDEADKERLRDLIRDADVVVDGYRPGAMERLSFGREDIFGLVASRERGIIHVRENCYGWYGPWAGRSGWQGISDACCGVSLAYGQAMGVNEPVTPPFPNSDRCTGVIGCSAVLHALAEKGEKGGSYGVDLSLNYYSQWLVRSCGTYPNDVWTALWTRHGAPKFHHYDNTRRTVPELIRLLHEYDEEVLFRSSFFEQYHSRALGVTLRRVKPIAQFKEDLVQLKYNIGTRGNGVDKARWPDDLLTEIVR